MFIRKSTHEMLMKNASLELEGYKHAHLLFVEYSENRVADLKAQIEDLKRLIYIPRSEPAREIYEADSVMSASEKPVEQSEKERNAFLEGERELGLLLGGTYDTDLINNE